MRIERSEKVLYFMLFFLFVLDWWMLVQNWISTFYSEDVKVACKPAAEEK